MPFKLSSHLVGHYRPATGNEVRAESYGVLKSARIGGDGPHAERGSFDDQSIFGPKRDFECRCGKYRGRQYGDIICDRCGVKVTTTDVRRTRSAHINLPADMPEVAHPLGTGLQTLNALPVLPVSFVEAPAGSSLLRAYERILEARDVGALRSAFELLLEVLAPALVTAHQFDLAERRLLAHGMALRDRHEEPPDWTNVSRMS